MLQTIQKLMTVLFKTEKTHTHTIVNLEKDKLKKDLNAARRENVALDKKNTEIKDHMNLWMRKAAQLQEKLSASQGEVVVLA